MAAALAAFGVVFVAEFGDRTQLLIVALAARHALRPVLAGFVLGYAVSNVLAVLVGVAVGAALPERAVAIGSGLAFLAFAAWTLLSDEDEDGDGVPDVDRRPVLLALSVAGAVVVSELGDKSQLAVVTLAADGNPVAVWVGATLGIIAAGGLGLAAGRVLADRLSPKLLRNASAALFAVFGLVLLARAA